jgi:hypothetical protein
VIVNFRDSASKTKITEVAGDKKKKKGRQEDFKRRKGYGEKEKETTQ